MPRRAGLDLSFERDEAATGPEHAPDLVESGIEVLPVVHGGDRPDDGGGVVGQGQVLGAALHVPDGALPREGPSRPQHDGCRIDAGHGGGPARRVPRRDAGAAAEVDDVIVGPEVDELGGEAGVAVAADAHAHRRDQAGHAGERGVVLVVVGDGNGVGVRHAFDLDT
jgi:hypothetical protein